MILNDFDNGQFFFYSRERMELHSASKMIVTAQQDTDLIVISKLLYDHVIEVII